MPTGSSASTTSAPVWWRTLRSSAWAQTAPNRPVLAPTIATGLPRSELSGNGREAQSIAFFSTPGTDALYSGVLISTASASAIAARRRSTGPGPGVTSASSSNGGSSARPSKRTSSAPGGSARAAARSRPVLWESRRSDPEIPRMRNLGLRLDQGEVDLERDVVRERVAAVRERHLPLDAEVAAVDGGLDEQVRALQVARGRDR